MTSAVTFDTLPQWLSYLETAHPVGIDMGLARSRQVWDAMQCPITATVITVGGTNGKGSTATFIAQMCQFAGYKTGLSTSPHLLRFNERCKIGEDYIDDAAMLKSFAAVEAARQTVNQELAHNNTAQPPLTLTYFEFTTLAIVHALCAANVEVMVLEIGLGGRLDTVNLFDSDCAVITSIDLDHMAYLGDTRELIGAEKAAIFRSGKPAIYCDPAPVQSVLAYANKIGADLWLFGRDFNYSGDKQQWNWAGRGKRRSAMAYPALRGVNQLLNASAAIAALAAIEANSANADEVSIAKMSIAKTPIVISQSAVRQGLMMAELPGRFQVIPGRPTVILDVAHNPHAAGVLAQNLDSMGYAPTTHAVFGCMADKDIAGVVSRVKNRIDVWHLAPLGTSRAATVGQIKAILLAAGISQQAIFEHSTVALALAAAKSQCIIAKGEVESQDRIIVFGSFYTVAAAI